MLLCTDVLVLVDMANAIRKIWFSSPFATDELSQAAKAVADVTLSSHLVEVVFALFDENSELF